MTHTQLLSALGERFGQVTDLLQHVSPDRWHGPQAHQWTIAQETEHLRLSTQGTVFLFSPQNRASWRPTDRAGRSYELIRDGYLNALAERSGNVNQAFGPTAQSDRLTPDEQARNWQTITTQLLRLVTDLPETDLDAFTVWKHPLLGPVTGREMLYFTLYHTQHHYVSLQRKQQQTPASR